MKLLLIWGMFLPIPMEAASYSQIEPQIQSILKSEPLIGSSIAISVRKSTNGELLYSSNGDMRLHPASNLKLLTAAAAFETLGKDYQFTTEVWINGRIKDNVLNGDLFLKGKGDPTLLKEDLDLFAKDLLANGIHRINGNIIADDSWYDDVRLSQDLTWSDESQSYGAQVSALTLSPDEDYDAGTIIIHASPAAKVGDPANLTLSPSTDYVKIMNETITVEKNGSTKIEVEREHGTNQVIIKGTIALDHKNLKSWIAVWEPTQYVLHVFKSSLEMNGIQLGKESKLLTSGIPKEATLLTYKKSIPLKDLLVPFMKLSNNGIGEILTKEMGKIIYNEGSWEKGIEVIRETISSFGINPDTLQLRDGSGISHKNMIPADELTQLLFAVQSKSWFPEFENSLPLSGMPEKLVGGTLRKRLTEESFKGKIKAKTGTIDGASTLSGYVTTKGGEKLIFSIMINNHLSESEAIKAIEDEITEIIVEY
jgi:serine-type D-Ala-D-Ala carboxypeptidase/endopeptidase (penicillin-binding protein 4)